jgi:hypothetical protein
MLSLSHNPASLLLFLYRGQCLSLPVVLTHMCGRDTIRDAKARAREEALQKQRADRLRSMDASASSNASLLRWGSAMVTCAKALEATPGVRA